MTPDNLTEIYRLNQRGGRPLSLLDLVASNTVDLTVAACLAGAVAEGATLLTAARPGNAGKATLLAAALAFLPPERRIVTVSDPGVLGRAPEGSCLLAHEIGSGPYYGYLGGTDAGRFFEAAGSGRSAASCIHADTLDELRSILCGPAIGLSEDGFLGIDVVAFLRLDRTPHGYRRRVAAVYVADPEAERHQRAFTWDEATDTFSGEGALTRWQPGIARARRTLRDLQADGQTDFEQVYARAQAPAGG